MRFWDLPGPREFLNSLEVHLRDGRNVVVAFPENGRRDCGSALEVLLDGSGWATHRMERAAYCDGPMQVARHFLESRMEDGLPRTTRELGACQEFNDGKVVIIPEVRVSEWHVWRSFICEYDVAIRALAPESRTLFVVLVFGVAEQDLPRSDGALSVSCFRGVVDELDMLLYVGVRLRERGETGRKRALLAAMIANLARWDAVTADVLLTVGERDLFSPDEILRSIAVENNWSAATSPLWHLGIEENYLRRGEVHSAYLAVTERNEEIRMRLWAGHAATLLPIVALQTRKLLPQIRRYLRKPLVVNGETIHDLDVLEVGQLHYLLCRARASADVIRRVGKLKKVRNALAHLDALGPEDALDIELLEV